MTSTFNEQAIRDRTAVEAIRSGDTGRFAELIERYERLVYCIAWARLGHKDHCEDAVQETFLAA